MMPDLVELGRIAFFHALQKPKGVVIARARANGEIEPRHGFQIVVEHVRLGVDDLLGRARLAQEVRRQDLDRSVRRGGADGLDHINEMLGAAIIQIIPVHRGDDDMVQPHLGHGLGDAAGLVMIDGGRKAGLHIAEGTGASAGIAQDHERGVFLFPALADIRAARLFAPRSPDRPLSRSSGFPRRSCPGRLDADPVRLRRTGVSARFCFFGDGPRGPRWQRCAPCYRSDWPWAAHNPVRAFHQVDRTVEGYAILQASPGYRPVAPPSPPSPKFTVFGGRIMKASPIKAKASPIPIRK